ncbi:cytochrome P450 [Paracoccus spongiarum]|uniref:Cytochrome P450 n=1 Tax=Paracoccus spongiarum TaxID=3064387 RepID=A0ABT9JBN0_9RHOB|nr:cytochrome P450 [Paracoccus sp. 2205BS29-5]MDP5307239.1 cytochrome P450 [Paracoccus sp. 2205BS29-5]
MIPPAPFPPKPVPPAPVPPKPAAREARGSVLRLAGGFRRDLLSALPARLFHAWMAEFRSPLIHSFLCNDPALVRLVLQDRPGDFPKSNRLREGLAPLLGNSVFVTNGAEWARQRRIIDPAFEGGRLREVFPAIWAATEAAVARLRPGQIDIEPEASHAAADVIFRALFSLPIEHRIAARVFAAFRAHQDAQPIVNPAALLPLPRWLPRWHSRRTRQTAAEIRALIRDLVARRLADIAAGTAPDDLASKIMTTPDPATGRRFDQAEMVDQVAIFFLAGHETSASALSWALWLLAGNLDWQDRVAAEGAALTADFGAVAGLRASRAVFREALRLYPPVPMMVRETTRSETLRGRCAPPGAQVILSPWHLHRHDRMWDRPDAFDPARWDSAGGKASARAAYLPFSAGPRACPGAGFAMIEGVVMLARIAAAFRLSPGDAAPVPVARLTIRGRDGILIRLAPRME